MIRVNILYPNSEGTRFDMDYYYNVHMPMSIQKLGPALKGVTVEHGLSGTAPGSGPAYVAMCHLRFESIDAFIAAFSPVAEAPAVEPVDVEGSEAGRQA